VADGRLICLGTFRCFFFRLLAMSSSGKCCSRQTIPPARNRRINATPTITFSGVDKCSRAPPTLEIKDGTAREMRYHTKFVATFVGLKKSRVA